MNAARDIAGDARKFAALPDPFRMYRGGELHGARVAFETWGELNKDRSNAILLFTGLSPPAHAASSPADPSEGWWEPMIGPGKALDTRRYFVICINSLGSFFGSTSPASIDPATGKPYRLSFPDLSVEDIARGGYEVARSLGIVRLDTVMGPSLGGMTVLAYVAQFPGTARRLVSISGSMAASPFAIALRSIQREAILLDPNWKNGNYAVDALPVTGMRIGRMLGMMTYRSAAEWRERFSRQLIPEEQRRHEPFAPEFQIQGYLEAHAQKFVKAFDPCCYIYISRAMDRFDLAAHGGGSSVAPLKKAGLESALVIGVESDMLFSIGEQTALAKTLKDGGVPTHFAPLSCIEGHDSFLIDFDTFGREIGHFLD